MLTTPVPRPNNPGLVPPSRWSGIPWFNLISTKWSAAVTEHRGRPIEGDTKTHRSRLVRVPESVLLELKVHMRDHDANGPDAAIFSASDGSMVRLSNWRHRIWQPAVEQAGLPPGATPNVLRHTAASLMAQQGVPVSTAAAALGHDPATYLRTYAHLYPGDLRSAADAMDAVRTKARKGKTEDAASIVRSRRTWGSAWACGSSAVVHRRVTAIVTADRAGIARGWTFHRSGTGTLPCTSPAPSWSGCRDSNPGPLDPQSSALTKLRHSPFAVFPGQVLEFKQLARIRRPEFPVESR